MWIKKRKNGFSVKHKRWDIRPITFAKSLVSKKTFTVGVVVPEIAHSFFAEAIQGIEEMTFKGNYQLILTHSAEYRERERQAIETLQSKRRGKK